MKERKRLVKYNDVAWAQWYLYIFLLDFSGYSGFNCCEVSLVVCYYKCALVFLFAMISWVPHWRLKASFFSEIMAHFYLNISFACCSGIIIFWWVFLFWNSQCCWLTGDENLIYANISSGFMDPKWKIKHPSGSCVSLSCMCKRYVYSHTNTWAYISSGSVWNGFKQVCCNRFILLYSGTSSLLRCTSKEVAKLNFHALMALLRLNIMSCQMFSVLVHISLFQLRKGVASLVVILLANWIYPSILILTGGSYVEVWVLQQIGEVHGSRSDRFKIKRLRLVVLLLDESLALSSCSCWECDSCG